MRCPHCKSIKVHGRGKGKYQCQECKKYFRSPKENTQESITEERNKREISKTVSVRITNEKQLISQCEIDTAEWEIERWTCNAKEVKGAPEFTVKAWLRRKVAEVQARDAIASLIEDAKLHAPKYKKISYPSQKVGLLYEIDIADLHFGKLAWNEETGQDYDIDIAKDAAKTAIVELLGYVEGLPVQKILLPLGNDFFNVNGAGEFTVNGTRQIEDTRWQKTFRAGRKLLVELVDMCTQVAQVDVLIIPGNHDRERMFYAGSALECWYHNHPNVTVDNRAQLRKYYTFGKNLIGFTHGSEEKIVRCSRCFSRTPNNLPDIGNMATRVGNVCIFRTIEQTWGNHRHGSSMFETIMLNLRSKVIFLLLLFVNEPRLASAALSLCLLNSG